MRPDGNRPAGGATLMGRLFPAKAARAAKPRRIEILDAIRGVAILAMIVMHALYDLEYIYGRPFVLPPWKEPFLDTTFFLFLRQPFTWAFILLAGVSSRFSHSNALRGLKVLGVAALLTLFTLLFFPEETIWFGILHFMGFAILLYVPLRRPLDHIPKLAAGILWGALFAFTFFLPDYGFLGLPGPLAIHLPASFFSHIWLAPLGLPSPDFVSGDYFPLVPWFFLFLLGTVIGVPIREHKLPERFYTARVPFFAFAGRHTLFLYLIHQPIVYGLFYFLFDVLKV